MKKLFLTFIIAGLMSACDSNKKSSSAGNYSDVPKPKTISNDNNNNPNNVSRINEPAEIHAPKNHMDSLLMHSEAEKQSSSYSRNANYHNGASGVGTGSSYAGYGYAQLRYKKKPKKVINPEPSIEQEITDNVNTTDSTGTLKNDSSSVNKNGW